MYCIETKHLTHKFSGEELVLNDINIQVPSQSIYGFLGPNGAGKTTTLRLILGLLKKQQGEINIFEKPFAPNRIELLKKIGSLIETPSIYTHLTATENLALLQKIYQCPVKRIQEVLHIVGLEDAGNKRTGKFSLGMKQRLSIAIALLHEPALLILDEPTNGLDPNGIIEIRELLKTLNAEQNMTIVISSHLLSEIEKLVTHVGIINKGKMLFQGTLSALHAKQNVGSSTNFYTNDNERTMRLFTDNNIKAAVQNGLINVGAIAKENIATLNKLLVQNDIAVYQISGVQNDLESIFIDLIK